MNLADMVSFGTTRSLRLSSQKISSHISVLGDSGSGKSLFLHSYLREVERRGDVAIVSDPEGTITPLFRSVTRGDYVIDPTKKECVFWDLGNEFEDEAQAYALASCFLPDNPNVKDPFWNNSARGLMSVLCAMYRPTIRELGWWCARDELIDKRVAGTEYERILTENSPGFRSSIISHLNTIAQPLRMMPQKPEGRRRYSARDWNEKRDSWVFISSSPQYAEVMKPVNAYFLASLIQRLVSEGPREDLPRVHLVFEEAASLTIQEFHLGLIRLRKTRTPVVYAIQNDADFRKTYGESSTTIASQPFYKIYFRQSDPDSAKRGSAMIGEKKMLKVRETIQQPAKRGGRWGRSWTQTEEPEPIVPWSTIQNFPDCVFAAIGPGKITFGEMPKIEMPPRLPLMERRPIPQALRVPAFAPDAVPDELEEQTEIPW